ncbi:hypothetical protein ACI65C_007808 [Semiaphis heraclei]
MNNDKITNKVIEWLQEDEDTNISDLNSETDTESEHSNHDTESEQSGFQAAPKENTSQGKPRCTYCPIRKNRFTQHQCSLCSKPICKEHTASTNLICLICNNPQDSDD